MNTCIILAGLTFDLIGALLVIYPVLEIAFKVKKLSGKDVHTLSNLRNDPSIFFRNNTFTIIGFSLLIVGFILQVIGHLL